MAKTVRQQEHVDFFTKLTSILEKFISENLKIILIGVGVIAVLLAAYFTVDHLRDRRESTAYSAFGKVYLEYKEEESQDAKVALVDDFETIIEAHPKSYAASESAYIIGNILYDAKRYDEAREYFVKSREIKPKSLVAVISLKGEAACYEQIEDYAAAENAYLTILDEYKGSFLVPLARFNLGQLYERQENFVRAEEEYSIIVSQYEWSTWKDLAEKRLLLIKGLI